MINLLQQEILTLKSSKAPLSSTIEPSSPQIILDIQKENEESFATINLLQENNMKLEQENLKLVQEITVLKSNQATGSLSTKAELDTANLKHIEVYTELKVARIVKEDLEATIQKYKENH
jgi:hypothetical protein